MQIHNIPDWLTLGYAGLAVLAATWRGGPEERAVAATVTFQAFLGWSWVEPEPSGIAIDIITLCVSLTCVLRSRSYWTVWAAASPLLSLATQALNATYPLDRWSYMSAQLVWFYLLITSLFVGGLTGHASRRRNAGQQLETERAAASLRPPLQLDR